jgi:cystathionine beta-lyase family protein involved in aluminum resistance
MTSLLVGLQATRPGAMLRGGTVVLLSRPHSEGFFMAPHVSMQSDALDHFEDDTLDRVLAGPSAFEPQLLL